MAKKDLGK